MAENKVQSPESGTAKVPTSFWEYVKSMGPGIVLVFERRLKPFQEAMDEVRFTMNSV